MDSLHQRRLRERALWPFACVVGLLTIGSTLVDSAPRAAESGRAPALADERAAVLGDLYAWEEPGGKIVLALTYAPGIEPGGEPIYDPDLLYSIWIHFGPDWEVADRVIRVRFGEHAQTAEWGVQLRHVPGAGEDLVGPVEQTLEVGTARAWVGLRDDPFFFDAEGLQDTLASGSLAFDATRDAYAGTNAMAIVIELDKVALIHPDLPVAFHATVGRAR